MGKVKVPEWEKRLIVYAVLERRITKAEAKYLLSMGITERTIKAGDPEVERLAELCSRARLFVFVKYN